MMNLLKFLILIIISSSFLSCNDDDGGEAYPCIPEWMEEGSILGSFTVWNGQLICPEPSFTLGEFRADDPCHSLDNAVCIYMNYSQDPINGQASYVLRSDCPCNGFHPDGMENDSMRLNVDFHSGTITTRLISQESQRGLGRHIVGAVGNPFAGYNGFYKVVPDGGDQFLFRNIDWYNTATVNDCISFEDNNRLPITGSVRGEFNEDDTYCEATFYWEYYRESLDAFVKIDSCNWVLTRQP